ncbi:hypothetical protein ABHI18_003439 [Aspergillus niger]
MLRLDRAAHWPLAVPVDWSPELERSLLDIRRYPGSVKLHDPGLSSHSLRMGAFYNIYEISCSIFDRDSWEEWLSFYPEGLDPHDQDSIDSQTHIIMNNHDFFDIWDTPRADREYQTSIDNYLERNWNGIPAFRYRSFEKEWCTDCRRTGYRTGCDQKKTCAFLDGPYYGKYWDIDAVIAADFSDPEMC